MDAPEYLPNREPDRITTDKLFEKRSVPGIGLFKPDDGIIYYYDKPLVFVAWIDGVQCFVTVVDEDYEGPPEVAKGWTQYIAIAVPPDFLLAVYNSSYPFRAAYETTGETRFIYEVWNRYEKDGKSAWNTERKIWKDVFVKESWRPDKGVFLDPAKNKETKP